MFPAALRRPPCTPECRGVTECTETDTRRRRDRHSPANATVQLCAAVCSRSVFATTMQATNCVHSTAQRSSE